MMDYYVQSSMQITAQVRHKTLHGDLTNPVGLCDHVSPVVHHRHWATFSLFKLQLDGRAVSYCEFVSRVLHCVCVCVCVCVRACVRACVRVCVRPYVCTGVRVLAVYA